MLLRALLEGPGKNGWEEFQASGAMAKVYHKRRGSVHWVRDKESDTVGKLLATKEYTSDQRHLDNFALQLRGHRTVEAGRRHEREAGCARKGRREHALKF